MDVPKIRGGSGASAPVRSKIDRPAGGQSFSDTFSEAQDESLRQDLQKKMRDIDSAAERLRKEVTRDALAEYKGKVKEFIEIVSTRIYTVRGKGVLQTMKVIDTVNSELEELTRIAMEGQKNILRVLQKLDEIRGLLLDLYS